MNLLDTKVRAEIHGFRRRVFSNPALRQAVQQKVAQQGGQQGGKQYV